MQEQENTDGDGQTQASLFRAAQYVRMSTDHQRYSTENQAEIIAAYAARRNFEIVRTYADEGRSGRLRTMSTEPTCASSARRRCETADCVTFRRCAARSKPPSSTMAARHSRAAGS